ncbi:MAG: DNA mismatch repair endonuclease MutL [Candidatus Omnitrophota bacterium]
MSTHINILSEEVIGKISAGEVVERPASVVKELIENSIDAGADSIDIEIENAGNTLIRVADSGKGMSSSDAKLACLRHATSKIKDAQDLYNINTLGFRGEALASIAAVSKLEITSFDGKEDSGVYLYIESGEILKTRPQGRPQGTTIEVRTLFYNVPVRRKFLRTVSTELSEIVSIVGRFAVSNPEIEIKLSQGGRYLLNVRSGTDHLKRISAVLGNDAADSMIEVSGRTGKYEVKGFISRPSMTRKDSRGQMFFMNGRFIKSKILSDTLHSAYKSMLERGRYPQAVLFLTVSPEDVDVNVHPSKLMVKFSDEKTIKLLLHETIRDGFYSVKERTEKALSETMMDPDPMREDLVLEGTAVENQPEFSYKTENIMTTQKTFSEKPIAFFGEKTVYRKEDTSIFQVGDCYIVKIENEGVIITDQHAAHERILYEIFSKAKESGPPEGQNLLFPVRLDLSRDETLVMENMAENFKRIGFVIESFGENSFAVQSVPAILRYRDVKTVVRDVLEDAAGLKMSKIDQLDELVKIAACRGAIKAGDKLEREEMISVLEQLERCELPFTCPHGRPTSFKVTIDEMEKRFRRK